MYGYWNTVSKMIVRRIITQNKNTKPTSVKNKIFDKGIHFISKNKYIYTTSTSVAKDEYEFIPHALVSLSSLK